MTNGIFGSSTPKGNVVWVPTALPALPTTLLVSSTGVDPDQKIDHFFCVEPARPPLFIRSLNPPRIQCDQGLEILPWMFRTRGRAELYWYVAWQSPILG